MKSHAPPELLPGSTPASACRDALAGPRAAGDSPRQRAQQAQLRQLRSGGGPLQCQWMPREGKRYSAWDAPVEGQQWYRKLTALGFQYAREPVDKDYPLKIFLTEPHLGIALPEALRTRPSSLVFGTQERRAEEVLEAFHIGYREFDCAQSYGNIAQVAAGLTGIGRGQYRIIYKFDAPDTAEQLLTLLKDTAALFGGHLDVAMLHNPPASKQRRNEVFAQLRELQHAGLVGRIGFSNVDADNLDALEGQGVTVVQNDLNRPESAAVREAAVKLGMEFQGYGLSHQIDAAVGEIAQQFHVSATALMLKWHERQGVRPVMSSGKAPRRLANADAAQEPVPEAALVALAKHFQTQASGAKTGSLHDLPEMPAHCAAFIGLLEKLVRLSNDDWVNARAEFSDIRTRQKHARSLKTSMNQPVPKVAEVDARYHGLALGQLIGLLPTTNHCDLPKLLIAAMAAARNVHGKPVEFDSL